MNKIPLKISYIFLIVIFSCTNTQTKENIILSDSELEKRVSDFKELFNLRVSEDEKTFSQEQLIKIENQYQIANKNFNSPEANKALISLINNEEFKGSNRIGCALLYLGQISENDKKEKYLLEAKRNYTNSWYGDGVNVGAYATYHLYKYYKYIGKEEDAKKCETEILDNYSSYIDHNQKYLKDILKTGN